MSRVPDVVILCGGAGVRLKSITGDSPKPMATIAGRPFLELLLGQLERYGFSRVILSAGYKHQVIREHFGEQAFGLELVYSVEESPLGTGGALAQAADDITTDVALIMNGDSYAAVDLSRLVEAHRKDDATDGTVVVMAETRSDAGSVLLDENGESGSLCGEEQCPKYALPKRWHLYVQKETFVGHSAHGKDLLGRAAFSGMASEWQAH